jgi:hypothetical protein
VALPEAVNETFTVTAPDPVKNSNTKKIHAIGGLFPIAMIHKILNMAPNE